MTPHGHAEQARMAVLQARQGLLFAEQALDRAFPKSPDLLLDDVVQQLQLDGDRLQALHRDMLKLSERLAPRPTTAAQV